MPAFLGWLVEAPGMISRQGVRLGPMRLTVYGAFAAVGVIAAMALSGRVARRVRLSADAAWDAGLFAILSCFAASRLLLILRDPVAFARFPLLVLSLPSLTIAGMVVAGAITWGYLRRRRLPVRPLLDVFAPCGAALAAFLELGHWADGSEIGMPVFRNHAAVAYQPVSFYGVALAVGIGVLLWTRVGREVRAGRVAGMGLMLGGLAAFGLDALSLPQEFVDGFWIEPGQMVALGAIVAGAVLWTFAPGTPPAMAGEAPQTSHTEIAEGSATPISGALHTRAIPGGLDAPVAAGQGEVR